MTSSNQPPKSNGIKPLPSSDEDAALLVEDSDEIIFLDEGTHHDAVVENVMALQTVIGNSSSGLKIVPCDCHLEPGPDSHDYRWTT